MGKNKRVSTVQKIEKNMIFLEGNGTSRESYGWAHIENIWLQQFDLF